MNKKWEHQPKAVIDIRSAFAAGYRRVGYMLSTGGGKSRICADIIKFFLKKDITERKRVLFVVNRKTLVNQTSKAFDELGIDHGVIQGDHWRYRPWMLVQICSIQSLMRRKQIDADFIIIDEFHNHFKYTTELMKKWNKVKFLGVSATPWTIGLGKHWDHLVIGPSTSDLQENGTLIPPVVYSTNAISVEGLKVTNGEYDKTELAKRVDNKKIKADVVDTYLEFGDNRKAICFPCNVDHSKAIVNEFNSSGIPALHIDCYTPDEEREDAFEKHKTGEVQILSSVGVLQVGHDEKSIGCVILARPIKSLILYIQCTGRGARSHPDLKDYILIDLGTNVERLTWPDDPMPMELCDGKNTQAVKDKEREEKKEKEFKDKNCPACKQLVRGTVFTCGHCGYIFSKSSIVQVENERIEKIERTKNGAASAPEKRNRTTPKEDKQLFYSAAISHMKKKGYKSSWAACVYRERFGCWPNAFVEVPLKPGEICMEFTNHLKHKNIKYAKGKKRS